MKIVVIIIVCIIFLFCFNACKLIRIDKFENQIISGFDLYSFDIDNSKYDKYKIEDILCIVRMVELGDYYEIHLKFASPIQKSVFLDYIVLANKKMNIKKDIQINTKSSGKYYIGSLSGKDIEKLLKISKKELDTLIKSKKFNISIYLKVDDKNKYIDIDMIRHKVMEIIWAT